MKLFTFFFFVATLQISAKGYSQNVNLRASNIPLKKAFREIEKQTGYSFFINHALLEKAAPVTLSLKNATINEALQACLKNQPLTYAIIDKTVILKAEKRPDESSSKVLFPNIRIKGVVTDLVTGKPLAGVTIQVKGSTMGTTTDANGKFSLSAPNNAVLEVSYLGYASKAISVNGRETLSISLSASTTGLNQLVVVGYGTQKRGNITTAVSTLKDSNLVSIPYTNIVDAIAGRVPGVFEQASGGEPGSVSKIVIRGGSGPDQGEPLFVIDNVISSKYVFENLQPQDIESMSFLKDGASTAIYGARGANGVVVVKTKQGVSGVPHINFSVLQEYSRPTVIPHYINSYQYANAQNEAAKMDGLSPIFSPDVIDTIKNHSDMVNYPDNNWYNLTMRNLTPSTKYYLDMSGGNDKTTYFLSLGAFNQGSMYKTDATNFQRYNFRTNITQEFKQQGLILNANLSGIFTNNNYPSRSPYEIFSHIMASPLIPAYNPNGTYAAGVDLPVVDIDPRSGYTKDRTRNANANVSLAWNVPWVKGLQATVLGYTEVENDFGKNWYTNAPQYNPDGTQALAFSPPSLNESMTRSWDYTLQARVQYQKNFGKNFISILGLYEQSESYSDSLSAGRVNYQSSAVDQLFAGSPTGLTNSGSAAEGGNEAFAGRVSYNYASKYLVEGSFRYNASDNFIPSKRWGFFPSLSAGWVISEEKFFQNLVPANIINYLKLRASVGTTGNLPTVQFPYLANYNLVTNSYVVGGNLVNGFNDGGLVSPTAVSWYTTKDLDYGGDFNILNNHINGSIDYFYKSTTGFTTSPTAGYTTPLGTSLPIIVSGSAFRSAGWDFSLGYKNDAGPFTYSVDANLSLYNQLWARNDNEDSVTLKNPLTRTTHETNYWGSAFINEGYYQSVNQIIDNPRSISSNNTTPGDIEYKDVNGDGKIDASDMVRLGKSQFPHLTYGVNFNLGYNAFSLQMLWQGTGTRDIYLGSSIQGVGAHVLTYNYQLNFWTPDNIHAAYPRQSTDGSRNGSNNYITSNFWLYNATYIRLKSLNIAFDVKKQFPKQLSFLSSCIINLSGTNLFTLSPVMKFFDPETSSSYNYGYPVVKTFAMGLTVGF